MNHKSIVVSDLDGTLLNSFGKFSNIDIESLVELGRKGVIRVIATGRSPYSFEKVAFANMPIDYLVFSSGAGVLQWSSRELLHVNGFSAGSIQSIIEKLIEFDVDFMVQEPIPTNHRFLYYSKGNANNDFNRRVELYRSFCMPLVAGVPFLSDASQVIAIMANDISRFNFVSSHFMEHKVIRATSPLDGESIWMEIFPPHVSKANGIHWLCSHLGVDNSNVVVLGNDYNDLDMLTEFNRSYVVSNAPDELKQRFKTVASNCESGFSQMVRLEGLI